MSRRDAREKAMQLLYQLASQAGNAEVQIEDFLQERVPIPRESDIEMDEAEEEDEGKAAFRPLREKDRAYLLNLVKGVREYESALNEKFAPYLVKWTPDRLPKVERILLQIGTYEMLYTDDIPQSVAINEIVRLAKKYADAESYSYMNAVLGKISREPAALAEAPERESGNEE